ncbi:MAG: hypothetical protein E7143_04735 [Rikenellaceae bacterium]|nr:hypothetical protein [Rikenellaceae bacterium]
MKGLLILLLSIFALSCDKTQDSGAELDTNTAINLPLEFEQSRISFDDNKYQWQGGESIGLFINTATPATNVEATVDISDGRAYCTTENVEYTPENTLYAYLPYSAANSNAQSVSLTIPATQSVECAGDFPTDAMPMVAKPFALGTDNTLLFQPMGAVLNFNVYASGSYANERVVSVRYATKRPISGSGKCDITDNSLALKGLSDYSVTTTLQNPYSVTTSSQSATPLYMVVAAGDYSGTLTVTTNEAIYSYNYARTAERNRYYDVNIDLSKAEYRKSLTAAAPVTATLTYAECKSIIAGYKSPKTYKNSYGSWTICAYNHNDEAIQINDGKVAYIGTPTFSGAVHTLSLTLTESYSDELYICTAAGSTSASGKVKSVKVSGKSVTVDLADLNLTSFYIRSGACMRISTVTITYGGSGSGEVLPDPTPDPDPTPEPDPTPDPTPDPQPSTARYDWAELPVIADANRDGVHDSDKDIYFAHHLCAGNEKNAQRTASARNYTVCYSGKHHCPLWVAAPRHAMYEAKNTDRTDAYGKDPKIPSSVQYNSKSTGGGCNKGHMLGSAERLCSAATNRQVFYYTNIAPQYSSTFNTGGGAWNNLEDHIDGLVCSDTLYVVVGCYFDSFSRNGASASPKTISFGGRSDVSCPTMFYYALLRTKKGSTGKRVQDCSAAELQCAAFTICHTMAKGHKPQAADMMSISDLEALTGFKYFENVHNAPKSTYNASDWL